MAVGRYRASSVHVADVMPRGADIMARVKDSFSRGYTHTITIKNNLLPAVYVDGRLFYVDLDGKAYEISVDEVG